MNKLKGIVASKGLIFGKCLFINKDVKIIKPSIIQNVDEEIGKFLLSQEKSIKQLEKLYDDSVLRIPKKEAMIFKSHQMMVNDNELTDKIINYIKIFKYKSDYAIFKAANDYISLLQNLQSEYISQRADDVEDVMRRLISNLSSEENDCVFNFKEPSILATPYIMPSDMISLDTTKVLGIITSFGGKTTHSAILAKNMQIPTMVINTDLTNINGKHIIFDGYTGEIVVEPTQNIIKEYTLKKEMLLTDKKRLKKLVNVPAVTLDDKKIKLMANVASSKDIDYAIKDGAEGIGLFRSEFLYIQKGSIPSEEDLFNEYKNALIAANGKEVVIRTIDIGSDKQLSYIPLQKENNPALGLRALRLCFAHLDIFKTQLRALMKSSIYGNLAILLPMVTSVAEVTKVKNIINDVKKSLYIEDIPFNDDIPLGVMVETPSAVMISDLLAKQVDFFSIGTNDLTQYTLACDRDNASLADMCTPNHISILRMIKMVIENAHNNNIWVEVCGEVAGDSSMTGYLIGLGVDRLSVDTQNLLNVKDKVLKSSYEIDKKNLLKVINP